MRKLAIYKPFKKASKFFEVLNASRVLHFKRPKWKFLQQKLKRYVLDKTLKKKISKKSLYQKLSSKASLANPTKLFVSKRLNRIRKEHKSNLSCKFFIDLSFDNFFNKKQYKQIMLKDRVKTKLEKFKNIFKMFFFLEIVLWKFGFFKSIQELTQAIASEKIHVNNKVASRNYVVKCGDIITLLTMNSGVQRAFHGIYFSCFEYNSYTRELIVLKIWDDLTQNDLKLMAKTVYNFDLLQTFLIKN